ncbi:restriction endonuclease subunit S [Xanthomonas campestris]|uniref:restriction endonuclease subunit S n=1 Tax=Xanthomonas campestris TaxID=339 RepID=UPI000E31C189|nr:restriction endonuclease subunit S [Xanthomonas campestris]MEA9570381.1 restriction endonuclease subunit S [Xanthomonas campestris]MEA9626980.1 restriction endonuclease subunit S [Xanthomonas campestris]MEA9630130.1 restriction endonuclease subunit S [Xanthomonas campestris]MEB1695430.1 restriction endonuclease subunit S [Xanthomonas campestris pv. campestris]RFF45720.1 restriction endonuclease subunit S [Xanthomonas campestris pv. campestris]
MLPDGWRRTTLGNIGSVKSGSTPARSQHDRYFVDGKWPWVKTMDLTNSEILTTDEVITDAALAESSCRLFPAGTVLVAMYGGFKQIGRTGLLREKSAINQAISAIDIERNQADPEFVLHWLNGSVETWKNYAASSRKDPNITRENVCDFPVILPTLGEQRRIAHILSTWDQAIATTERLLKNSQKQMDILLRDLTLGTQRTTSTPSPWAKFTLGELGRTYSGLSGKKGEDFGFGAKFIPYTNVFKNNRIDIEDFSLVKISENENQTRVKSGDIIFTISSETPNEVGMASVLLDDVNEIYLNSFCFGYRLNDFKTLLPEYAGFVLRAPHIRALMTQIAQGSTRFNISKANVMRMELALPSIAEQKRIASILGGAHSTVKNLRDQLARLKAEKVILMSQLLTGKRRVRLPTDEAAHA